MAETNVGNAGVESDSRFSNNNNCDRSTIELTEESRANLVKDYAPLAALLQQLDQQVSSFSQHMETLAYKAAPDYEGLTQRWTQEAALLNNNDVSTDDSKEAIINDNLSADK